MDPPAILKHTEGFIWKYGLPLVGVGVGYALGDLGLADAIQNFGKDYIKDAKMSDYLAAATYFIVGCILWAMVPHIGGLVGGVFIGMSARVAIGTFTG